MHKIEFSVRNMTRDFPSELEEMTREQFLTFVDLALQHLNGKINIEEFKIRLVKSFLQVKLGLLDAFMTASEREDAYAEIYRLSDLCESFFEEIDHQGKKQKTFKLKFTKNFIPKLKVKGGALYGPADSMLDATFAEYRIAHGFFVDYIRTSADEDLNKLCAALYRPRIRWYFIKKHLPSFSGAHRVPITSSSNPLLFEKRVRSIARLPVALRYAIFLFFSGCEQFLATGTIQVDGKPIDLSIIYEKSEDAGDSPDIGLVGILYSLAETKVFGSIEETDNQNLYDVMVRLYQVVKQSRALEEKYKQNGTS